MNSFWWIIFLILWLCYHRCSGGRGAGLWWRSSSPGHSSTLTINWIMNVNKESEIDRLSVSLDGLRISHLLVCHWAELSLVTETTVNQTVDPTNLNKTVKTIMKEGINAFSSKIMYAWPNTMYLGSNMLVMMQALEGGNDSHLPHELSILNAYTMKQASGGCSEESDCCSDCHHLRSQDHLSHSCKWYTQSKDCARNVREAGQYARDPEM